MHKLELLGDLVGGLTWERSALQLGHHASVAELLDVVDVGHAMGHSLLTKLLQDLEVKVPKTLMLVPCFVVLVHDKAKGVCHLHMNHINAVASQLHLGEKTVASILDV